MRRLLGRRRARYDERRFVAEGSHALTEALAAGHVPEVVFVTAGADAAVTALAAATGAEVRTLAPGVLERAADAVNPPPIAAVFPFVDRSLPELLAGRTAEFLVVAAGIADPGNLGTIIRTAEASGAGGVLCCDGTVDLYNPKVVRATTGSLFHLPVSVGGLVTEVLDHLAGAGYRRYAAVARDGTDPTDADLTGAVAVVVGNESHGIDEAAPVDGRITITMTGRAESLNAGVATAVICFEAARQRRRAGC